MNDVLNVIKNRRSIRKYKKDQIRQEDLDLIIEAGSYAPTACNEQPWHFTIIQSSDLLAHINDLTQKSMAASDVAWHREMGTNPAFQVTYGAPTFVVVSGRADATAPRVDCAAALENMLLAASSLGIGSVWLGLSRFFLGRKEETLKLGIPEGYEPYYGAVFGYAAEEKPPVAPKRNADIVNYIR